MDANCAGNNVDTAMTCCHIQVFTALCCRLAILTAEGSKLLTSQQTEATSVALLLFHIILRATWIPEDARMIQVGGDHKGLMLHMDKKPTARPAPPRHLNNIMEVISNLEKIARNQGWSFSYVHYPKHHPMMREVDAIGRLRAYRSEADEQLQFPDEIWRAMDADSKTWQDMRRRGVSEPLFSRRPQR